MDDFLSGRAAAPTYVAIAAEVPVDPTGALRRRTAAEMRVMIRPTGSGSIKVYAMLTNGFW